MVKQIFINISVKDLDKAVKFYKELGFTQNQQFSDENTAGMELGENIFMMVHKEKRFLDFISKEISDAKNYAEVIISLALESREEVDTLADKALEAGAAQFREPQEYDWMYERNFTDPDGHNWEVFFMDISKMPQQ